ncbi:hypothetical protein CDCA_CDCA12G3489 [Cyanidium caldarium]|uniref:Uncharacterized protein n=1 Tax=Cyanidium caldarium TaxID=2771 RepID=A0AAV9IYY1_CYACA|nr:hypothetical protein CDCA_CDCA12G3489 [Cyanidium caldarium]|eukprot:ctg_93.g23
MEVSVYERERQERIQRNREWIAKLGVNELATGLRPEAVAGKARAAPAGLRKRKTISEANGVDEEVVRARRMSLRVRGRRPEGDVDEASASGEGKRGTTVVAEPDRGPVLGDQHWEQIALRDYGVWNEDEEGREEDDPERQRRRLVERFATCLSAPTTPSYTNAADADVAQRLPSWSLHEERGFAKLVPDRVYSAVMLPRNDQWVVAVGDKWGRVGLLASSATAGAAMGILSLTVHRRAVSGLAVLGGDGGGRRLLTTSYDGSARVLDLEKQMASTVFVDQEERLLKSVAVAAAPTAATAARNSNSAEVNAEPNVWWSTLIDRSRGGCLVRHDLRTPMHTADEFFVSDYKLYSVDACCLHTAQAHSSAERLAVATARDGVLVYDTRRLSTSARRRNAPQQPLCALPHERAVTAARWSPSGTRLLTTCYDDRLRIWHGDWEAASKARTEHTFVHNNNTGRWVTAFDARWNPASADDTLFACGSMHNSPYHGVDVFHTRHAPHAVWHRLGGDAMTAIAAVLAWHPGGQALAGATASGRLYLWCPWDDQTA